MTIAFWILSGILALAFGVYLGRPASYDRSMEDVERSMDRGSHRRQWTKRHFTPLDLLRKERKGSDRRRARTPFGSGAYSSSTGSKPSPKRPGAKLEKAVDQNQNAADDRT